MSCCFFPDTNRSRAWRHLGWHCISSPPCSCSGFVPTSPPTVLWWVPGEDGRFNALFFSYRNHVAMISKKSDLMLSFSVIFRSEDDSVICCWRYRLVFQLTISSSHGWLQLRFLSACLPVDKGAEHVEVDETLHSPAQHLLLHWSPQGMWKSLAIGYGSVSRADISLSAQCSQLQCTFKFLWQRFPMAAGHENLCRTGAGINFEPRYGELRFCNELLCDGFAVAECTWSVAKDGITSCHNSKPKCQQKKVWLLPL